MTQLNRRLFIASATAALLPARTQAQQAGAAMRLRCRFADHRRNALRSVLLSGLGNLALFHADYVYHDDLIWLGRIQGSVAPLLVKGNYPLRLDLLS